MTAHRLLMWAGLFGIILTTCLVWIIIHITTVKLLKKLHPTTTFSSSPVIPAVIKNDSQNTNHCDKSADYPHNQKQTMHNPLRDIKCFLNFLFAPRRSEKQQQPISQSKGNKKTNNYIDYCSHLFAKHVAIMREAIGIVNHLLHTKGG